MEAPERSGASTRKGLLVIDRATCPALVRRAAFVAGVVLALALAVAGRIPAATGSPGLALTVNANLTGELDVAPTGVVLSTPALGATGRSATVRRRVTIRNQTDATLAVRLRAERSVGDVDGVLRLGVDSGGRRVLAGTLGAVQGWSAAALRLAPGERRTLVLTAGVDPAARERYAGHDESVTLLFRSSPLGHGARV